MSCEKTNCKYCKSERDDSQKCIICHRVDRKVFTPYHTNLSRSQTENHAACVECWSTWEQRCDGSTTCPICLLKVDIRKFYPDVMCSDCQDELTAVEREIPTMRPRRRRVRNRFPWNNFSLCVVFSLIFIMGLGWFYFTLIEALDSKEFEKAALLVLNNNRPLADVFCKGFESFGLDKAFSFPHSFITTILHVIGKSCAIFERNKNNFIEEQCSDVVS